jgi:predicted nuclease of predicted toxin-antitoxin system
MKFLVDNALSPLVAQRLVNLGYDAIHVREIQMHTASDEAIFSRAQQDQRIIISSDTDFAQILALRNTTTPSLILFRKGSVRSPHGQVKILSANLSGDVEKALMDGSVVVFEEERIRIRKLPFKN